MHTLPQRAVHAIVSNMTSPVEILANHHTIATSDRDFRLLLRMPDRHHILVHVEVVSDHFFLSGSYILRDFLGRYRMGERVGELTGALCRILPAKELFQDLHVSKQVGDDSGFGFSLYIVEQDGKTAV